MKFDVSVRSAYDERAEVIRPKIDA